jgi:hypothetical protein
VYSGDRGRRFEIGRALAVVAGLAAAACVEAPTEPSPAPLLQGDYILVLDASSVCDLPTTRFQWGVEARTVGSGAGANVRVTLPPGDNTIDVSLTYGVNPGSTETVATADYLRGPLTAQRATFEESLFVTVDSQAQGPVSDAGGRGKVEGGTFNGTIWLTDQEEDEDPTGDSLGSCTAADHVWNLLTP